MEPIDYDVSVRKPAPIHPGSRGKKISRVGKEVQDMYVAFRFWRKINYSRGHQRSCSRKSLDLSFLCSTYDKILFLPGHAFYTLHEQTSLLSSSLGFQ